jgi:hypothetical protein
MLAGGIASTTAGTNFGATCSIPPPTAAAACATQTAAVAIVRGVVQLRRRFALARRLGNDPRLVLQVRRRPAAVSTSIRRTGSVMGLC